MEQLYTPSHLSLSLWEKECLLPLEFRRAVVKMK